MALIIPTILSYPSPLITKPGTVVVSLPPASDPMPSSGPPRSSRQEKARKAKNHLTIDMLTHMAPRLSRLLTSVWFLVAAVPGLNATVASASAAARPAVVRDREAGRHVIENVPAPIQRDTTAEPSISVKPDDPRHAVVVYMEGRNPTGCAQAIGYATTLDGGKTWTSGDLPGLTAATGGKYPLAKDPVVAFGPKNTVYAAAILCTEGEESDIAFTVSTDGGRRWGKATVVPAERSFPLDDKPWMVVDNNDAPGHHLGRVYLVWGQVAPVVAMYSDDGTKTWNGPFVVFAGVGIGALPLVLPGGDLAVVFKAFYVLPQSSTYAIAIASGAGTVPTGGPLVFGPAVPIAKDQAGAEIRTQRAAGNVPTADVDPDTGRIYVAWTDARFRDDGVNDIVIASSDDGYTWTEPKRVNPGPSDDHLDHFAPWLVVGNDGGVRIAYRTQQEAEDPARVSPFVDTWYQQSSDAVASFSPPIRVNTKIRSDVRFAATAQNRAFFGEYAQIAAAGSWTYVARCEAFPLTAAERRDATFPPNVHHQRTWVAVVDSDGNGRL